MTPQPPTGRRCAAAPRHGLHRLARLTFTAAAVAVTLAAGAAHAATAGTDFGFDSGSRNLFGFGVGSFGSSGYIVGNRNLGVSYNLGASTGTVRYRANGVLTSTYDPTVVWDQAGSVHIQVGWDGTGGSLATSLGAWAEAQGHVSVLGVRWEPTMLDQNYALHINRSLSGDTGSTTSGSDSFTPGSVGLNAPDWFPASAGVGVDLDVIQRASLQLDGLQGQLQAIHRDSGTVRSASFSELGAADSLHFDLGLAGTWDFSFQQVSMLDTFNTRFSMGATAYAQYRIGFNCGDLGTDSDNGFGCGGDGRVDNTLADVSLFSLPGQRLGTQALSSGTVFSVDVLAAPVPEPGTWALMLAGVGAVALRQQRLRRALER